jgi:hypothetical protein
MISDASPGPTRAILIVDASAQGGSALESNDIVIPGAQNMRRGFGEKSISQPTGYRKKMLDESRTRKRRKNVIDRAVADKLVKECDFPPTYCHQPAAFPPFQRKNICLPALVLVLLRVASFWRPECSESAV